MSYGIQSWGTGGWGGADFIVINHIPFDNSIGINRLPIISFTLLSQSGSVITSSINLTIIVNMVSIPLIINGVFTANASGTINASVPTIVNVTAQILHSLAPFSIVNVVVAALANSTLNSPSLSPASGTTWLFAVDNTLTLFSNYIVRRFERVLRVGVIGLDAPQNPMAVVELAPPPNFMAVVV